MKSVWNVLSFINENSAAINLVFSLVVAVSTVIYALLTAKLVNETRILRTAQTEPLVIVNYKIRDDILQILDLNIENVGPGPAYDVKFKITKISDNDLTNKVANDLEKISLLKKINCIAPRQRFNTTFINTFLHKDFDFNIKIRIEASYKSSLGLTYKKKYDLDLSELKGFSRRGHHPLVAISHELKGISENLKTLNSTLIYFKNRDYFEEADLDFEEADPD